MHRMKEKPKKNFGYGITLGFQIKKAVIMNIDKSPCWIINYSDCERNPDIIFKEEITR